MKLRSLLAGLLLIASGHLLQAQEVASPSTVTTSAAVANNAASQTIAGYQIGRQDGNSRVWQKIVQTTDAQGNITFQTNQAYVELATGLNHLVNGQWVESKEEIDVLPDGSGAVATNGQHQVYFPADIAQGEIRMVTPEGKLLSSRPVGLSYDDGSNTVLIAELTNSIGELVGSNQVIYPDAFIGFKADLLYTYTKGGFEQDIILREQPPAPEDFNLASQNCRLQMLTEFFDPPQPTVTTIQLPDQAGMALNDDNLDFGVMQMMPGKAFLLGTNADNPEALVAKEWVNVNGQQILVEEVPVMTLADELLQLPTSQTTTAKITPHSPLYVVSAQRLLPTPLLATVPSKHPMQMAQAAPSSRGLVLDYSTVNSSLTNYTFQGDTTYYISGAVNLFGTNTLEGGAVLKFGTNSNAGITGASGAALNCLTAPYRPAILTAVDDNSVGSTITNSTGNPTNTYALQGGLTWVNNYINLHDIRVSYLNYGVVPLAGGLIRNAQFVQCYQAFVYADPPCNLENVLFEGGNTAITCAAGNQPISYVNCTFHDVGELGGIESPAMTNCLVAGNWNNNGYSYSFVGVNNVITNNDDGIFQSAGAGSNYLASGSPYRNAGTTNIDPTLLASLAQKTTYPPNLLTNAITNATVLSPVVQRDTDTPDLGYHYDPLDYLVSNVTVSASLTLTNGVALGLMGNTSLTIQSTGNLISQGTPLTLDQLVNYANVQEQPLNLGSGTLSLSSGLGTNITASFWFTDFSMPAGRVSQVFYTAFNREPQLSYQDCTLHGCSFVWVDSSGPASLTCTNNLFDRCTWGFSSPSLFAAFYNNLFRGGAFPLVPAGTLPWYVQDNLFDQANLSGSSTGTNSIISSYNGFTLGTTNYLGGSNNITNLLEDYQTGPLGNYYYPTSGTNLATLINAGSTNASLLGLYHYTTTTNQVQESNSIVDIGFHYVATDTNGNPLDTLWFGIPDYLADFNGSLAAWELEYFGYLGVNPNADPDGDGLDNLQEYLAGSNPLSGSMVVAWGDDSDGQCDVPAGLVDDVVAVAGGYNFSLALKSNGTVIAWGDDTYGETNVPAGLTNVTSIAAGGDFALALLQNGTVAAWGGNEDGQTNVPAGLTNVMAIAAGDACSLALRSNGSVVAWGYNYYAQTNVPALGPVSQIAAGVVQAVALLTNSTVTQWGNYNGSPFGWTTEPSGLSNVVSIAAGACHTLAVNSNGTVTAWGAGATDSGYDNDGQSIVPAGLSNVVVVAGGYLYSVALQSAGTVVAWGDDYYGETDVPDRLTGVKAISAGGFHGLAVRAGLLTPLIVEEPGDQYALAGATVTFTVDATALVGLQYQWQFNGVNITGATSASLTLTNVQAANNGSYQVIISNSAGSVTSDAATFNLILPPQIISTTPTPGTNWISVFQTTAQFQNETNIPLSVTTATYAGQSEFPLSYQWQTNGVNVPSATSATYPLALDTLWSVAAPLEGTYTVNVSNAAGSTNVTFNIRVLIPGMVAAWGDDTYGECDRPVTLTNVIALAAGEFHSVAVMDGGSVMQWGYNWGNVPANLTNAVAVAAGYSHSLALRNNGTITAWGNNTYGQTNVPANVTNAIAVAAGGQQSLALLQNGTVVQWGLTNAAIPAGLTNVTAIAAGTNFCLALLSNATVVAWGANNHGQTNVPNNLTNVVAIAASGTHALALLQNGTIVAWGDNTYGETNVPANLTNAMAVAAGDAHSVALLNNGTVVCWGDNTYGETNVPGAVTNIKLIAAGGYHTLATMFSWTAQYPVNVTKDLLLIYNTNSVNSITVENYYLQNRPLVGRANVLGIGCLTNEIISRANFTNQILTPYLNWLTNNPTKRPQYLVLFSDIPSRIEDGGAYYPSVQYQLSTATSPFQPFVTSINMGGTNDCIAYINKLAYIGTNYSPGKLIISASAGGYGNTNYYFDNVRDTSYYSYGWIVSNATNGVIENATPPYSITYTDIGQGDITNATNIAGYMSWGVHSDVLNAGYPTNRSVIFTGQSTWYLIGTCESFNGQIVQNYPQGNFIQWFSSNAFGGTNYSNTPIGAVTHVEEPDVTGIENSQVYFGMWAAGKNFGICAWNSRQTGYFQAVGDPFITR